MIVVCRAVTMDMADIMIDGSFLHSDFVSAWMHVMHMLLSITNNIIVKLTY